MERERLHMILAILTLLSALSLAGVAAYFSVIGFTKVFVGAIVPVAILASAIEVGKLIGISWLYQNWKMTAKSFKVMGSIMIAAAMLVTAIGIFGFLSRAYLEHQAPTINMEQRIANLNHQIESERQTKNRAQKQLDQIQRQLDTLIEYDKISGDDGYRAVRQRQLPTIKDLEETISKSQSEITALVTKQTKLQQNLETQQVEVGPIRYVAELFWDANSEGSMDRAVKLLIILIMFVFDPFAIVLLLMANESAMRYKKLKGKKTPITKFFEHQYSEDDFSNESSDDSNDSNISTVNHTTNVDNYEINHDKPTPPPSYTMHESSDKRTPKKPDVAKGYSDESMIQYDIPEDANVTITSFSQPQETTVDYPVGDLEEAQEAQSNPEAPEEAIDVKKKQPHGQDQIEDENSIEASVGKRAAEWLKSREERRKKLRERLHRPKNK